MAPAGGGRSRDCRWAAWARWAMRRAIRGCSERRRPARPLLRLHARPKGDLGRPAERSRRLGPPRPDRAGSAAPRHAAVRVVRQRPPRAVRSARGAGRPHRADRPAREPGVRGAAARARHPGSRRLLRRWEPRLAVLGTRAPARASDAAGEAGLNGGGWRTVDMAEAILLCGCTLASDAPPVTLG